MLAEFEFDSTRKRMSTISQIGNDYYLYTKGADNKMIPCIRWNTPDELETLNNHLYKFAIEGLRTLVMGRRKMSKSEFDQIMSEINNIQANGGADKDNLYAELYEKYETNLEFIGASAIEDKLQDEVPETIAKLMEANIRVWVLTGDKQETAVEIAKSCKLIQENFDVVYLTLKMEEIEADGSAEAQARHHKLQQEYKVKLRDIMQSAQFEMQKKNDIDLTEDVFKKDFKDMVLKTPMTIVIDGPTLGLILGDGEMEKLFLSIGFYSKSVV